MAGKLNPLVTLGTAEEIAKIMRMFVEYDYRFLVTSYENFYKNCETLNKKC